MGLEFDQSQVKWEYFQMSTLLNIRFNEITIFTHFKISIVTHMPLLANHYSMIW